MSQQEMEKKVQIHLILYFVDGSSENKFLDLEKKVLDYLISNPIPILFIVSHCENNPNSIDKEEKKNYKTDFEKIKNALIKTLGEENYKILIANNSKYIKNDAKEEKKIYRKKEISIKETKGGKVKENGLNKITEECKEKNSKGSKKSSNKEETKNIVLVNFKNKKVSKFSIPPFGIETIFSKIYYFLSDASSELKKVLEFTEDLNESEELNKKEKEKMLEIMIKKNIFFKNFTSLEDREKDMENRARTVIKYQTFYAGTTGLIPIVDIASHYYIKRSLSNQIGDIYGFKIKEDNNSDNSIKYKDYVKPGKEEEDKKMKKKEAENEIYKNTQSSLANTGKTTLGIFAGEFGKYFLETAVSGATTLAEYGLRFASSMFLLGGQIILGVGYGGYKMYQNGEEILKIYKSKYFERKYESLISYITSLINAINYFQILSEGFEELNDEKGELKRDETKFDITIILEKYKIEVDFDDPEIKKKSEENEENNFGFDILE